MNQLVPVTAAPAFSMSDIERVALAIAKGGLFGSKDPNAVLTLCLLAQAEGQHPAVVFRDYHIIQGRPAKKADAMLRDFINAGGHVEWHQLDDTKADATFTHPSGSARIDWTLERAKKAQLTTPMWSKYPRQMLRSRVISEGVRTVYPGATSGLYEENEVRDIVGDTSTNPAMEAQEGGFLEGQFQEASRTGEPQESATPTTAEKPKRGSQHSALKTKLRGFVHELEGIADWDVWCAFRDCKETRELLEELQEKLPHWWDGWPDQPEEFVPYHRRIELKEAELANQIADIARV